MSSLLIPKEWGKDARGRITMAAGTTLPQSNQAPETPTGERSAITDNDRLMAALAYVIQLVVPLIILLTEGGKKSQFQRYHAIQSLGLSAVAVVYEIVATIVSCGLTALLPVLGCVTWVLFLLPVVPFLYYAYQAYQGQYFEIPVLTKFMREQKWL